MGGKQISIDYDATIQKAKELEEVAGSCDQIASSADKLISILEECWKGDSGIEAADLCRNWKANENKAAEKMRTVSQQIIMVANSIKNADEAAANRNRG